MGKRPAIIAQEAEYNLPTVLIVPLTTKIKALDSAGTILIKPDERNHLDLEHQTTRLTIGKEEQKDVTPRQQTNK